MEDFLNMLKEKRSRYSPELILEARRLQKKFIREDMGKVRSNRLYKLERIFKS